MVKKTLTGAVAAVLLVGSAAIAADDNGGKRFPASEYRHNVLEQVKYSISNIRVLLMGHEAGDGAMAANADVLHKAATMMKGAFAEDTRGVDGKTDAKDAIWENWDDFSGRVDAFVADTGALKAAVDGGDRQAIMAAVRKTYGNCKGCHDNYKKD